MGCCRTSFRNSKICRVFRAFLESKRAKPDAIGKAVVQSAFVVDNVISFFDDNYNVRRINILNGVIIIYDVVLNYTVEGDMGAIQPASLHTPWLEKRKAGWR